MTTTADRISSDRLHATCVAIGGLGVLLAGRSGSGKSDLALRLIDRGAQLVADDCTLVVRRDGTLHARAPDTIRGHMEVRGLGLVALPVLDETILALFVDLDSSGERMPSEGETRHVVGVDLPALRLDATAASAPIKVEWALRRLQPDR